MRTLSERHSVFHVEAAKRAELLRVSVDRHDASYRLVNADAVIRESAEVSVDHPRRLFTER
jgi:hypothetical protein